MTRRRTTLPSSMHSMIPIVSSWSISPLWSASNLTYQLALHLNLNSDYIHLYIHISLLLIREKFHPHFKGPTEFFFWRPGADKVVDHDELKEVHVPIAVSVKSSECSNLKHLLKSDFPNPSSKKHESNCSLKG